MYARVETFRGAAGAGRRRRRRRARRATGTATGSSSSRGDARLAADDVLSALLQGFQMVLHEPVAANLCSARRSEVVAFDGEEPARTHPLSRIAAGISGTGPPRDAPKGYPAKASTSLTHRVIHRCG